MTIQSAEKFISKLIPLFLVATVVGSSIPVALAQSYTAIELAPNHAFSAAQSMAANVAAGYFSDSASFSTTHAVLWKDGIQTDLHPTSLVNLALNNKGRSSITGSADGLQVGWGAGAVTNNRNVPMAWYGTADSAVFLNVPFDNLGGQALGTDGNQITGYAYPLSLEGNVSEPSHALLWDAHSGAVIDLGDGGNGAQATGVRAGEQVGFTIKDGANAVLWHGTRNSMVLLHPKNAASSVANDTNGVLQVGNSGYDIRVRNEAPKGNKTKRFYYATVWSGTAASAINIHPYPFTHSYAASINGAWIAGYAADETKLNSPAYFHAIVWDANFQFIDLQEFLPENFVGSQAFSVDDAGNIAGVAQTADGQRHAVVWMLNPV